MRFSRIMAMIICPGFRRQVSDKSNKCVQCGVVMIQKEKMICAEYGAEFDKVLHSAKITADQ